MISCIKLQSCNAIIIISSTSTTTTTTIIVNNIQVNGITGAELELAE